jgi:xylulokinase
MPRLVEGSWASGRVRAEVAARWGFDGPVIVAGGAGDVAAGGVGLGAVTIERPSSRLARRGSIS